MAKKPQGKLPTPAVEMNIRCISCGRQPVIGNFPRKIGRRGDYNEVEAICSNCGNRIHFLSSNNYPESYTKEEDNKMVAKVKKPVIEEELDLTMFDEDDNDDEFEDDEEEFVPEPKKSTLKSKLNKATEKTSSKREDKPAKERKPGAASLTINGVAIKAKSGASYDTASTLIANGRLTLDEANAIQKANGNQSTYPISHYTRWLSKIGFADTFVQRDGVIVLKGQEEKKVVKKGKK
jgi:hypothetical protein